MPDKKSTSLSSNPFLSIFTVTDCTSETDPTTDDDNDIDAYDGVAKDDDEDSGEEQEDDVDSD